MAAPRFLVGTRIETEADQSASRWFAGALLIGLICGWVVLAHLPSPLVLPVLSTLLVVAGFSMATVLYLAGSRIGKTPSPAWQVAGALVFLGFAAAILSDSEQALGLFEQMQTPGEESR